MKIRSIINGVYREEAPAPEEGTTGAGGKPVETETPPVAPEDEGQDTIPEEANLWEALSDDADDDELEEEAPPEDSITEDALDVPTPEEEPAEPEAEPATETPAEEPTAEDTAVPTEPEVQPTIEPEPEPIPQPTEEEQAETRAARKTEIETTLTDRFQLSQEEALQLVTDPGKVFPKLQARMFTDMWLHVEAMIDQRLPSVIETTTRDMKIRDEKVDDFFKVWPQLDRKAHGAQVAQVAAVFAGVNPSATEKEVIENVGMQVMMMNGITPETPNAPETPAEPNPETPPYRPATVNGAPAVSQRSSDNLYEAMSIELEADED